MRCAEAGILGHELGIGALVLGAKKGGVWAGTPAWRHTTLGEVDFWDMWLGLLFHHGQWVNTNTGGYVQSLRNSYRFMLTGASRCAFHCRTCKVYVIPTVSCSRGHQDGTFHRRTYNVYVIPTVSHAHGDIKMAHFIVRFSTLIHTKIWYHINVPPWARNRSRAECSRIGRASITVHPLGYDFIDIMVCCKSWWITISRGWARQKGFTIDCAQINQLGLIKIVCYNRIFNIINKIAR